MRYPPGRAALGFGALALGLLGVVLALASGGLIAVLNGGDAFGATDLDAEHGVAAATSSGLLLGAGVVVAAAHLAFGAAWQLYALPALLVFMAVDEYTVLHEELEQQAGVDWQVLYSPLILAGGIAWLLVLRRWGPRSLGGALLLAGAVAWGVSQVLENLQWGAGDLPVPGYTRYMLVEEVLEAAGSALFLLAGSWVLLTRWMTPSATARKPS